MRDSGRTVSPFTYSLVAGVIRLCFRICHPVIRVQGRENLPEGAAVVCANHSSFTDPLWILAWARFQKLPRTMAKKELFQNSLFGWFLGKLGAFPVDRGNTDLTAIKTAFQTLKEENKLLIFPEGTRVRKGKTSESHPGAIVIAHRMKAPIVPVYLSVKKGLFRPVHLIFGSPYSLDFGGRKPDTAALNTAAAELMSGIYTMGESL